MPLHLLVGGARSGKSAFAQRMAAAATRPVVAVVTAEVPTAARPDHEMTARIARHRAERPDAWTTVEAPRDLAAALADAGPDVTVLLDCLSLWVSNRLADGDAEDAIVAAARSDAAGAAARSGLVVAVTNEVGTGLVPMHPVGRAYRDVLGRVNAEWSAAADRAWLVVAGRVLELARPPV